MMNFQPQYIRREVANKGYGLEILVNDPDSYVSSMARRRLQEQKDKN